MPKHFSSDQRLSGFGTLSGGVQDEVEVVMVAVRVIQSGQPWWAGPATLLFGGLLAQALERTRAAEADTAERAMAQHLAGVLGGDQPGEEGKMPTGPRMEPQADLPWGGDLYSSMLSLGRGEPWMPSWAKGGLLQAAATPPTLGKETDGEPTPRQRYAAAEVMRGRDWSKPWRIDLGDFD